MVYEQSGMPTIIEKNWGYRSFSVPHTEVRFISIAFTGVKKDCIIQLI